MFPAGGEARVAIIVGPAGCREIDPYQSPLIRFADSNSGDILLDGHSIL